MVHRSGEVDRDSSVISSVNLVNIVPPEKNQMDSEDTNFHPESQGAVERFHKTLKNMIRSYCFDTEKDLIKL